MHIPHIPSWQRFFKKGKSSILEPSQAGRRHVGHTHFWERALSRRQFIQTAAGVTGVVLGSRLWRPTLIQAGSSDSAEPKPVPKIFLPSDELGMVNEPSSIADFNGFVGQAHVQGTGRDTTTDAPLLFDADVRFMQGVFIGVDALSRVGTFGFV
jgi:hypothetical protein